MAVTTQFPHCDRERQWRCPQERRRRLFGGLVLCAVLAAATGTAQAEVRRYAFLVGANRGAAHEVPLQYAESDVDAVANVLIDLGGFPSEQVVRLLAPTADRVRKALIELGLRIQRDLRGGGEAVLFAYYSGHADAQSLHLGEALLGTEELSNLVRLSDATLKVLLLDACRSGALTRVKGGRQATPFQIGVEDHLRNEGYAIITSSTAGEDSQESDALGSSIFTHHFLAGLRGLADLNRDQLVTLAEVYAYAQEQTLKSSLQTLAGSQHATYEYDLRGKADPVLTDLRDRGRRAELVLNSPGEYLLLNANNGALLMEAGVKQRRTTLQLAPGHYRVRARTRTSVYETDISLAPGQSRVLGHEQMRAMPLAQVVRKGETSLRVASGPTLAGTMHGPLATGFSPMVGAQVGWAFELPHLSLIPRLGWATGRALEPAANIQSHTFSELTAELTALYVVDFGRVALAPLLSLGWGLFNQNVQEGGGCTQDCTEITRPQGLITTIGGWASVPIGYGFSLEASLELANFYLRRQTSSTRLDTEAGRAGTLTYRGGLGLGYRY